MNLPTHSQLIEADERLTRIISHFYCVQHSAQALPLPQQLMPNYEMLLIVNFGPDIPVALGDNQFLIRQTAVLGPVHKTLRYELPPGADCVVVNFTLDGFYRLLGQPMHQPNATTLPTSDVVINQPVLDDLWQRVARLKTPADRVQSISEYALLHLSPADDATRSLMDSIPYFKQTTIDPVKAVAQTHRVSTRSIQTRFRTHLGYSAKELIRFLRFRNVLAWLCQPHPAPPNWLTLVHDFGYHDQSHLIKDFRYFVGVTPRQFLRQLARGGVCISKPGKFY